MKALESVVHENGGRKEEQVHEEQIIGFLKQAEAGMAIKDLYRRGGSASPAGGLSAGRVHVLGRELDAARRYRHGFVARRRYRPDPWDEVTRWHGYAAGQGERWFGFACVRKLTGLPPELLLVPLRHTEGHSGVAIDTGDGWLLHAGDAYFHSDELTAPMYRCPPGLRGYQRLMEVDRQARLANQHRLRQLAADDAARVRIISGHDAIEFDACARGRPLPSVRR